MSKTIDIVLENCEIWTFKQKDIRFSFSEIEDFEFSDQDMRIFFKKGYLVIRKDAKARENFENDKDWQKRFRIPDIVSIDVDGIRFFPEWIGDEIQHNEAQTLEDDGVQVMITFGEKV